MWQLEELAKLVDGRLVLTSEDSADQNVTGAASVTCVQAGQITFVKSLKYLEAFEHSPAIAALVAPGVTSDHKTTIEVAHPEAAFAQVVALFRPPVSRPHVGISPQAIISPSAAIADDATIYPGAVIMDNVEIGFGTTVFPNVTIMENCRIGARVTLFPNVTLYENTIIGDRCLIHSGVVLGAYGFGYQMIAGEHRLSSQLGNVVVESDVEIGANTTIDRATYDSTVIRAGTKIDDLVMIGHNSQIGPHNLLCSQVGIAGSCQTGDYVVMGGQVGVADHLRIGSHAAIGAKSGLMHDVTPGTRMFGIPARPARDEMQIQALQGKLPEMRKAVRELQRQIAELSRELPASSGLKVTDRDAA